MMNVTEDVIGKASLFLSDFCCLGRGKTRLRLTERRKFCFGCPLGSGLAAV